MWYRFSQNTELSKIDEMANLTRKMNPYHPLKHLNLISELGKQESSPLDESATIDERLDRLHQEMTPLRDYHDIHPQVYVFPSIKGTWHSMVFDPKNLKVLDDEDYHDIIDLRLPVDYVSEDEVIQYAHSRWPTATIDVISDIDHPEFQNVV